MNDDALGAVTWRNSHESFCQDDVVTASIQPGAAIWSDERGVFLLVAGKFATVHFNAGDGWSIYNRRAAAENNDVFALTGFPSGSLLQYSSGQPGCGIEALQPTGATCIAAPGFANKIHVVDADLAYAAHGSEIWRYSGGQWLKFGDTQPLGCNVISSLWASHEWVSVGSNNEKSVQLRAANSQDATVTSGAPDITYTAAWGLGEDQFRFGTSDGRVVQGTPGNFATIATQQGTCPTAGLDIVKAHRIIDIQGLWGVPDALYFWTSLFVGVVRDGRVDTVLSLPCDETSTVEGVWGNAAQEVFVVVRDKSPAANGCGNVRVLWFNGEVLAPL